MIEGLKRKRLECNMTQTELAEKVGVTQGAIWQWENGKADPSLENLKKMATFMGCTIDELLGEKEGPNCPTERPNEGDAQNG